jgi:hypothetical protein
MSTDVSKEIQNKTATVDAEPKQQRDSSVSQTLPIQALVPEALLRPRPFRRVDRHAYVPQHCPERIGWKEYLLNSVRLCPKRINSVSDSLAPSRIEKLHSLCEEINSKSPPEAFCYLWEMDGIQALLEKLLHPDYLGLLDQLCIRHYKSCKKATSLSSNNKGVHCSIISILEAFHTYTNSWYKMKSDKSPHFFEDQYSFVHACTEEQVSPLTRFINEINAHYAEVSEAKEASEAYARLKRQKQANNNGSGSEPQQQ